MYEHFAHLQNPILSLLHKWSREIWSVHPAHHYSKSGAGLVFDCPGLNFRVMWVTSWLEANCCFHGHLCIVCIHIHGDATRISTYCLRNCISLEEQQLKLRGWGSLITVKWHHCVCFLKHNGCCICAKRKKHEHKNFGPESSERQICDIHLKRNAILAIWIFEKSCWNCVNIKTCAYNSRRRKCFQIFK